MNDSGTLVLKPAKPEEYSIWFVLLHPFLTRDLLQIYSRWVASLQAERKSPAARQAAYRARQRILRVNP